MKKTLHILGFATLLAGLVIILSSCESKKSPDALTLSATVDTAGLAEFQATKALKAADMSYMQGYKDAIATKSATQTKVVYKRPATRVVSQPVVQPKKKGWSKAAKGTAIGAAGGAIAGALIGKNNRLMGGIIGGLVGGGGGYLIGHGQDKKDGRY